MKLAWRIAIGVGVIVALVLGTGLVSMFCEALRPERPVGFQDVSVAIPQGKPLYVHIWYPASNSGWLRLSASGPPQVVATHAPVTGLGLPLVLISHGGGAPPESNADTALALASAGFVVAAVRHTEDETADRRYVVMPHWLADRPREVELTLKDMLNDWPDHPRLDPSRVGIFGYSNGGLTALILLGGRPNSQRIAVHWVQPRAGAPPIPDAVWIHDGTIRAAVLAAPAAAVLFEPDGLSRVNTPIQLWSGGIDRVVKHGPDEIRRLLPSPPEYHAVSGAGHFSFVAPCAWFMRPLFFCADDPGFDRATFHRDFNRSVVAFFTSHLGKAVPPAIPAPTSR